MLIRLTHTAIAAVVAAVIAPTATASVVEFHSRFNSLAGYTDANDLRSKVEALVAVAPTTGYCDATPAAWNGLSNQTTCGGGSTSIAFKIGAEFSVGAGEAGVWNFRVGPDFGLGGALFIDGAAVDFRSTDMWWAGSYGDPSQILVAAIPMSAGNHEVIAYGLEGCCDGAQQAQFMPAGSTTWLTFGADDRHDPTSVPEPGTLALFGAAVLAASRRRRQ